MVATKKIVTTNSNEVLCIPSQDTNSLASCNYEEVDTYQLLITWDLGSNHWNYCGPHYLSQVLHPENCFTVGARRLAQDDVYIESGIEMHCSMPLWWRK